MITTRQVNVNLSKEKLKLTWSETTVLVKDSAKKIANTTLPRHTNQRLLRWQRDHDRSFGFEKLGVRPQLEANEPFGIIC